MTPKEKAIELVDKFYCKKDAIGLTFNINWSNAKQCALIAVDEIIKQFVGVFTLFKNAGILNTDVKDSLNYNFWQEVKQEIEKL